MAKAEESGIEAYREEQREKEEILKFLLENYNDGRKKTLFCLAVNLLDLADLRSMMQELSSDVEEDRLSMKEKAARAAKLLQDAAAQRQILLKLRK